MLNLEVEVPSEPVIEQRLLHIAGCLELEEGRGKQSQRQVQACLGTRAGPGSDFGLPMSVSLLSSFTFSMTESITLLTLTSQPPTDFTLNATGDLLTVKICTCMATILKNGKMFYLSRHPVQILVIVDIHWDMVHL